MRIRIAISILVLGLAAGAAVAAPQDAVLVLDGGAQGAEAAARFRSGLAVDAAATEVPVEELEDLRQAGILTEGGRVAVSGESGLKVYDGATGKPAPAPNVKKSAAPLPAEPKPEKKAAPAHEKKASYSKTKKNRVGALLEYSALFARREDSFDALASAGGSVNEEPGRGGPGFFYERDLSDNYAVGIAVFAPQESGLELERINASLELEYEARAATIYVSRRITKGLRLFAGAGLDSYEYWLSDPVAFAGTMAMHSTFGGEADGYHAEAGVTLSAGGFSLRLGMRQYFFGDPGDICSDFMGGGPYTPGRYRLIVRNGQTLDFKAVGQPLAANEKLFKPDLGGPAFLASLSWAFGW